MSEVPKEGMKMRTMLPWPTVPNYSEELDLDVERLLAKSAFTEGLVWKDALAAALAARRGQVQNH